ncbi:MAG: hypothetical protein HY904_03185 [Deltaproteobacteria bacterium]|nr:hypothetical protein [Deltaproteobacteria bacterium]
METTLPPLAARAIDQVHAAALAVLEALADTRGSARWQELRTGLDAMERALGAGDDGLDEEEETGPAGSPAEQAAALRDALASWVLHPVLLQRATADEAVFAIRAPAGADAEARELAATLEAMDLAIAVRPREADGSDLVLTAGGRSRALVTLSAGPRRLDLVVDLAAARGAMEHLAHVVEAAADRAAELELAEFRLKDLAGVIAVTLAAPAGRFQANVDLRKDLRVEGDTADGPVYLRVGAASPLLRADNHADRGEGTLTLALGAVRLKLPQSALPDQDGGNGALELAATGLRAVLQARAGERFLRLAGFTLGGGDAVLTVDGVPMALLGIRGSGSGGAAALLYPDRTEGAVELELETPWQVALAWDGQAYRIRSPGGAVLRLNADDPDTAGLVTVLAGDLSVAADGARKALKVGPGQGLYGLDEDAPREDEEHPVLRLLDVR